MKYRILLYILLFATCSHTQKAFAQTDTTMATSALPIADSVAVAIAKADSLKAADTAKKVAIRKPIVKKPVVKKIPPISREFSGGFRINSDGWSIFADKGFVQSEEKYSDLFYDLKLFQVELSEKKHPKELKRSNDLGGPVSSKAKPFIFGKINNFYSLKIGYGKRKMIAGKPEPGNISIHWVYLAGLSAGLEKPYYLEAYVQENRNGPLVRKDIRYTDTTKEFFLDPNFVIGGAGFSQGLSEIKVVPGLHAKTALHFDFAPGRTNKLAIETGVNAELYSRSIGIMANQKAVPYFVNIYASIQFGRRK